MAGVYPDNTWPARARGDQETPRDGLGLFDNPRTEYLGALLRRTRGPGFNVGIVTTADLTDATPAANAIHSSNRLASEGIASRYLDERGINGISVLMGGGLCHFVAQARARRPVRTQGRARAREGLSARRLHACPDANGAEGAGHGRECASGAAGPVPAVGDERGVRQDRRRRLQRRTGGRRRAAHARPADAGGDDGGRARQPGGAFAEGLLPDGRRRLHRQAGALRSTPSARSGTPSSSIAPSPSRSTSRAAPTATPTPPTTRW